MTIPTIPADELPSRDDPSTFAVRANNAWANLSATVGGINLALTGIDAAVAAVSAGITADVWSSGSYDAGDFARSPSTGFLYQAKTTGSKPTDPALDATNWELQTSQGLPISIVTASTHLVERNTAVFVKGASQTTLTIDSANWQLGDRFELCIGNGREDNELDGDGIPLRGQSDTLYLDTHAANGVWRYWDADFGLGI